MTIRYCTIGSMMLVDFTEEEDSFQVDFWTFFSSTAAKKPSV